MPPVKHTGSGSDNALMTGTKNNVSSE